MKSLIDLSKAEDRDRLVTAMLDALRAIAPPGSSRRTVSCINCGEKQDLDMDEGGGQCVSCASELRGSAVVGPPALASTIVGSRILPDHAWLAFDGGYRIEIDGYLDFLALVEAAATRL